MVETAVSPDADEDSDTEPMKAREYEEAAEAAVGVPAVGQREPRRETFSGDYSGDQEEGDDAA